MNRRIAPLAALALLAPLLALAILVPACRDKPAPATAADLHPRAVAAYAQTKAILDFGPRPAGSEALTKVRTYLSQQLQEAGWQTRLQSFSAPVPGHGEVVFNNLIARFGDTSWEAPARGILGAHVDSKFDPEGLFLGADDAASACALLVELARDLAVRPAFAEQIEIVFFDGEEAFGKSITRSDGLYGSKFYANQWRGAEVLPSWGIVLDMVGHRDLAIRYPSDTPPHLARILQVAARHVGAERRFQPAANPIIDDHVPLNNAGIPSIDIIGDFTAADWWHTPADNLDLISQESLDTSFRVTRRMIIELLGR